MFTTLLLLAEINTHNNMSPQGIKPRGRINIFYCKTRDLALMNKPLHVGAFPLQAPTPDTFIQVLD